MLPTKYASRIREGLAMRNEIRFSCIFLIKHLFYIDVGGMCCESNEPNGIEN